MKIFMPLALVVIFALFDFSRAEDEPAEDEPAETMADSMYRQFCNMTTEVKKSLLLCLAQRLPEVVQEIKNKNYDLHTLSDTVCQAEDRRFPEELLLHVGKVLPYISLCLQSPEA
uniref:Putative secreted protein n=1 Tax=Amblyomma americanum TaxID=6943 RepID=A0A0C9R4E8_AMBAM